MRTSTVGCASGWSGGAGGSDGGFFAFLSAIFFAFCAFFASSLFRFIGFQMASSMPNFFASSTLSSRASVAICVGPGFVKSCK